MYGISGGLYLVGGIVAELAGHVREAVDATLRGCEVEAGVGEVYKEERMVQREKT